jgi:hypothetical protein
MTPNQARQDVGRLITYLLKNGIAIAGNMPMTRRAGHLVIVEPPAGKQEIEEDGINLPREFGTIDDYLAALRRRDFACVLKDGSLLQIAFAFRGEELVKHRLCFHPCPLDLDFENMKASSSKIFSRSTWKKAGGRNCVCAVPCDSTLTLQPQRPCTLLHICI